MCSGVQRGTPVCCCNYLDYTCYGVLQQSSERVQFNQQWIWIFQLSCFGLEFNQWRHIHMLSCCVCLCARIISKMLSGLWCSRGVLFFCFWSSCRDRFPACIQICDSPEKPIGEAYSPRRCQVPDSEQMLTNTNAPEGPPVCVCMYGFVCFPPSFV